MSCFPELRPNRWDGLVLAAVAVLGILSALVIWRSGGEDRLTAVISVDGAETERVDLTALSGPEEHTIEANGYTLRAVLTASEVWVESSDCPTQDCVHTGHIRRVGQSIVCLPARVSIQLTGPRTQDSLDAVIG